MNRFSIWRVLLLFWSLALLLMHFTLSNNYNQLINGSLLAVPICLLGIISRFSFKRFNRLAVLVCITLMLTAFSQSFYAEDLREYGKTLLQLAVCCVMAVLCASVDPPRMEDACFAFSFFVQLAVLHSILLIAQCLTMNLMATNVLMSPLGEFSRNGPTGEPHMMLSYDRFGRANGLFSEPSVAGWYCCYALALCLCLHYFAPKRHGLYLIASVFLSAGAISTLALSGLLNLLLVLLVCAAVLPMARVLSPRSRVAIRFALISITLFGCFLFAQYQFGERANEFTKVGSSGYVRVIAPLMLVSDSLIEYPLGYPLGNDRYVLEKNYYQINQETATNPGQLHNGFFVMIFYFGVVGLVFVIGWLWVSGAMILRGVHGAPVVVAFTLASCEHGGIWASHSILLLGFTILAYRCFSVRSDEVKKPQFAELSSISVYGTE